MNYLNEILSNLCDYNFESVFYSRKDLIPKNHKNSDYHRLRSEKIKFLYRDVWYEVFDLFSKLGVLTKSEFLIKNGAVSALNSYLDQVHIIQDLLFKLIPWRKGPWMINDIFIDSEWDSSIKYSDISNLNFYIKDKIVADVGGGNGYYSFRAINEGAEKAIVFDPSEKFFFQFELFQKFLQLSNIQYEMLGYKEASSAELKFDTVLCMGVLYHQKNAFELLENLRSLLSRGGTLILESMIYDVSGSHFFIPEGRYAKARNVYFLPTIDGMTSLLKRCGFSKIELVSKRVTTVEEQRKTAYMPYESLSDFLDPKNDSLTVEGYQRPIRATIKASLV